MRRDPAELPFTGRTPRRAQGPDPDRQVSYSAGRAFLRETARHDPDYSVTVEDRQVMEQRRLEDMELRQARKDANFAAALRLGAAIKGGG